MSYPSKASPALIARDAALFTLHLLIVAGFFFTMAFLAVSL